MIGDQRLVDVELSGQYPPTEDQLEAIFDLIEDRSSWPILVHCLWVPEDGEGEEDRGPEDR